MSHRERQLSRSCRVVRVCVATSLSVAVFVLGLVIVAIRLQSSPPPIVSLLTIGAAGILGLLLVMV